jgi:F0F1-type ATP synthase membrane subunit c/vacuolar-type H+-ATPase subunit K
MKLMKTKHFQSLSLAVSVAAAALIVAGCASTAGYNQGNITAAKIQSTSDQIAALPGQLDKTLASLNTLVNQPQADLQPQYKDFNANVAKVQSAVKDIAAARTKIATEQTAFFAKWDQEIAKMQNLDIKALSQSRRDQVAQNLTALKTSYAQTDMTLKPFLADIQDVQNYLSVDLTAGGVAAIKGPVAKANQDAVPLKASLTTLAGDFKTLGASMSSRQAAQ